MNVLNKISYLAESSAEVASVTVCSTDAPKGTSTGRTAPTINYKILISILVVYMGLLVKVMLPESFDTVTGTFQDEFPSYMENWISTGIINTVPSNRSTEEQCDNFSIHFNRQRLSQALKSELHGQHLAAKIIMDNLQQHTNNQPASPLILSMHGPGGVGKTHASHIIAHHLHSQATERCFVREFNIEPYNVSLLYHYHSILDWIKRSVSACPYSVFIMNEAFDNEVFMKSFAALLSSAVVEYKRSIFLLTSRHMSDAITNKTFELKDTRVNFHDITLENFDEIIKELNSRGFMYGLLKFVIVPFLPLTHSHVRWCIQDELKRRNCAEELVSTLTDNVVHELKILKPETLDSSFESMTSCALVSNATDIAIEKRGSNCIT